ncbi:hypothetical protein ACHQM5_007086 [Ranunculus cassubicifolius]
MSVCGVAVSTVFLLYKHYKYQLQKKLRSKKPKCTTFKNLPADLVVEIFSYFSVKDFLNCQGVWKQLNDLRKKRYFVEKFMMHKKVTFVCNRLPTTYHTWFKNKVTHNLATCDGLILKIQYINTGRKWIQSFYIENPGTREILMIPRPPVKEPRVEYAFAFMPLTGVYKVVSVCGDDDKVKCAVLTLGDVENKWRDLDMPERRSDSLVVVPAGTVVHCVLDFKDVYEILSLDLETECFTITNVPRSFIAKEKKKGKHWAINWNEQLSFVYLDRTKLNVLVLEDHKEPKWADKLVISFSFFEDKIYEHVDIVPISAQNGLLWFKISDHERIGFDLETGKIAQKLRSKRNLSIENRATNRVFPLVPSLITLQGMQPTRKKPLCRHIIHILASVIPYINFRYGALWEQNPVIFVVTVVGSNVFFMLFPSWDPFLILYDRYIR